MVEQAAPPENATKPREPGNREQVIAALRHHPNGATDEEWKATSIQGGVKERTFYRIKKTLIQEEVVRERGGLWMFTPDLGGPEDDIEVSCQPPSATMH